MPATPERDARWVPPRRCSGRNRTRRTRRRGGQITGSLALGVRAMTTDENTRPLTGLFGAPVATAEPAADAPRATTTPDRSPRRLRLRAPAPRSGSRRARLIAAVAVALFLLLLGLITAGHGPKRMPVPVPARSAPVKQSARPVVRSRVEKRAPDRRPRHHRRRHQRRRHRHVHRAVARAVAPPVLVTPAPAPVPPGPVSPSAPSWHPALGSSGEPEFF